MATKKAVGRSTPPDARELEKILGRASTLWIKLHAWLEREFGPLVEKWNWSPKTERWSLQLKRKDRTILYMIVAPGYFITGFALGEKACAAAAARDLPGNVLEVIEQAPRYAEGRGVWLDVRSAKDVASVRLLAAIKMAT